MKVTLYKNCILNSNYTEVFRNKTLIDEYLNNISANDKMVIEIDNTYMKLRDTLVFYLNGTLFDMYNYNYMVCENDNKPDEKIYCFIQSVEIGNEACRVSYICDVWSTFIDKWTLRESLVTRSRITKPNEFYELPFLPATNGCLMQVGQNVEDDFAIIIEFQIYTLLASDNTKKAYRENYIGIYSNDNTGKTFSSFANANNVILAVNQLLSLQNNNSFQKDKNGVNYYFQILNIYVIPSSWVNAEIVGETVYSFNQFADNPINTVLLNDSNGLSIAVSKNLTIEPNIFAIGFTSKYFPITYNSEGLTYKIEISSNYNNFKIYLNTAQIGLKDITDCFRFEIPFSTVDAGTLAQQRIADNLQKVNGEMNIINGFAKMGSGLTDTALGIMGAVFEDKDGIGQAMHGVEKATQGITNMVKGVAQIDAATAEKYVNTSAVSNDTDCFANAYYGVSKFSLSNGYNDINNFYEFQKAINETGYIVDYFVNDLDLGLGETAITDYNVVKFDFVRLIGISEEINNVISSILLNGVKIWYTINV